MGRSGKVGLCCSEASRTAGHSPFAPAGLSGKTIALRLAVARANNFLPSTPLSSSNELDQPDARTRAIETTLP